MKFLVIQTAFIGDVVLATPIIEKLHRFYPEATIDVLVRKGNEGLLNEHPYLRTVLIWDKKGKKYRDLWRLGSLIRLEQYDWVINCQRFAASGLLTAASGAKNTVGFWKNPFALLFTKKIRHNIGQTLSEKANAPMFGLQYVHEVERNLSLITHLTDNSEERPKLHISDTNVRDSAQISSEQEYVCIAPTSVWFTKQWPAYKWVELIGALPANWKVFLLGAPSDRVACADIAEACEGHVVENLAGKVSFLTSAALMKGAKMNFVNDSAPLHFASAVNAPVTAIFCSTVPAFGFTPLSDLSFVVETPDQQLSCRPCGLHGYKACPKGHFKCATQIESSGVAKGILPFP